MKTLLLIGFLIAASLEAIRHSERLWLTIRRP